MDTSTIEATSESTVADTRARRRRRTGKKRLKFGPPQNFPRGVRELWTSATSEEQASAHLTCTQILALWLGKKRREEVASELSIPGLRVWQLSQQALSGMLAGLLHQPRPRRATKEPTMEARDDDPRVLKKKIAELERRTQDQQALIALLTSLPKPRGEMSVSEVPTPATKTRTRRARAPTEDGGGTLPGKAQAAPR